jgi:hypothetical protein
MWQGLSRLHHRRNVPFNLLSTYAPRFVCPNGVAPLWVLGAQFTRDLILDAWLASADAPVGYPMVNVRDIESGKVRATRELMGAD